MIENPEFEAYWSAQGARFNADGHKERAQHAYEAGKASVTTPTPQDFWLDRVELLDRIAHADERINDL